VTQTIERGKVVFNSNEITAAPGHGRLVRRAN
jgi:hypothetical protein